MSRYRRICRAEGAGKERGVIRAGWGVVRAGYVDAEARSRALACQRRIRRAASMTVAIRTAIPRASSSPAQGRSSNALPPIRPMKNA